MAIFYISCIKNLIPTNQIINLYTILWKTILLVITTKITTYQALGELYGLRPYIAIRRDHLPIRELGTWTLTRSGSQPATSLRKCTSTNIVCTAGCYNNVLFWHINKKRTIDTFRGSIKQDVRTNLTKLSLKFKNPSIKWKNSTRIQAWYIVYITF